MKKIGKPLALARPSKPRARDEASQDALAREWVGGSFESPFYVTDRAEPYRAQIALWLEQPEGLIVGTQLSEPEQAAGLVGRALAQAMRSPVIGPPRRPARIRVADAALIPEIRAELGPEVPIDITATPELDELLREMLRSAPEDDEQSYLEGGRVPPDLVAYLFHCALSLYEAAPWRVAADDQVLRVDIPELGVEGACVAIIGALGQSTGLLIFPSFAAYAAFAAVAEDLPPDPERADLGTELLSLEFEHGADLPAEIRSEVAQHGWTLAAESAYPRVCARERDGLSRPLSASDVQIAAACAGTVAAFFLCHRKSFESEEIEPVCESYDADHPYGVSVTLTAPYQAFDLFDVPGARAPAAPPPARAAHRPSRNAPCPCGSGKKYKKCHLPIDEAADATSRQPHALHELDARLAAVLIGFAEQRFGRRFRRAWDGLVAGEGGVQLFAPLSLYVLQLDGAPVVEHYRAEREDRLSGDERAWFDAQRVAWLSIWEVLEVHPGEGLTLRDLLTQEQRRVREASGSRVLIARDTLLVRVVDCAGSSVLCGTHPRLLRPAEAAEVVVRARKRLRLQGAVPPESLRDEKFARHLIELWERGVAAAERRAANPPALQNTDGDAFLLTIDHFDVDPSSRAAVEAALATLEGVEREEDDSAAACFIFLRPGNPQHKSWENTIVGHARLSESDLRLETNSRERADALRASVDAACGDRIHHRAREHADPLSRAARTPAERLPAAPPEAAQLLLEFKQRHYQDWLDEPVPALQDKTPREAARSASLRPKLDLLLKQAENTEARSEPGTAFDITALRRELGME